MIWTKKQIELSADFFKSLSLIILPASAADAILDGSRTWLDLIGIAVGAGCFALAVWLTGKVNGDRK